MRSFVVALLLAVSANASTFVVSNTSDSGAGSLRQAILDANANPGADLITFAIGSGPASIAVVGSLPAITEAVTIDGTTQPGFAGQPIVEVYGTTVDAATVGFDVMGGPTTIRGLIINRFGTEIKLHGVDNLVAGNWLGLDTSGNAAAVAYGTLQQAGIDSPGYQPATLRNRIGGNTAADRNVISGNEYGIRGGGNCCDTNTFVISGNFIGTNAAGTAAIPQRVGVQTRGFETIGGATFDLRNVISGNETGIEGSCCGAAIVIGNLIGLDASGRFAVPNTNGTVGVSCGAGNVISGNGRAGVVLKDFVSVSDSYIGTDITGLHAVPNGTGILCEESCANTMAARNLVSGNTGAGISRVASVSNNRIGLAADGSPLGNGLGIAGGAWCAPYYCGAILCTSAGGNLIAYNGADYASPVALGGNFMWANGDPHFDESPNITVYVGRSSTAVSASGWAYNPYHSGRSYRLELFLHPEGPASRPTLIGTASGSIPPQSGTWAGARWMFAGVLSGIVRSFLTAPQGVSTPDDTQSLGYRSVERVNTAISLEITEVWPNPLPYGDPSWIYYAMSPTDARVRDMELPGTISLICDGKPVAGGLQLPLLSAGTHTLELAYGGDQFFDPGRSTPFTLTVNRVPTIVSIESTQRDFNVGSPVKVKVNVKGASANAPRPTGDIVASVNRRALLTKSFQGDPVTFEINSLSVGSYPLTFAFHGNPNYTMSSVDVNVTVSEVAFIAPTVAVAEGNDDHVIQVPVHLSQSPTQTISVDYATCDGTATAGEDYEPTHGTLVFAPGVTTQFVPIRIFGDTKYEDDETIALTLSNAVGAPIRAAGGTIVLANDDLPYEPSRHYGVLDLFTPAGSAGPWPLILWIPGNVAFDSLPGSIPALDLTKNGYAVAVVPYRPAPSATFPAQLDDLRTALAWIRANASMLNVDATRIAAWGDGAGGALAALLGESHDVQAVIDRGGFSDLQHLVSDAPPCGALDESPLVDLLGCSPALCPDAADAASPVRQATTGAAPFLIMHGEDDCLVPAVQSLRLATALQTAGADVTLKTYPLVAHFDAFWSSAECLAEIENFLTRSLRPPR